MEHRGEVVIKTKSLESVWDPTMKATPTSLR